MGLDDVALEYYQQALEIQQEIGYRMGEAGTLNNIGSIYKDLSRYEQALEYFHQALPIWQEIGNKEGVAATLQNFGEILELLGKDASEALLHDATGNAGIVHLAAHGSFNQKAPLFSRLWLTPGEEHDGYLNVHEAYSLDLSNVGLVVLSACETQLGELSAGDYVVGLNRAFLYGTPTVIASLWSVNDEATGVLMESFYTYLDCPPISLIL